MDHFTLDASKIRDISPLLLDVSGCLRVVPAQVLSTTTPEERILFGVRNGLYSFPTTELCDFVRERIAGRAAIEIGSGHGVFAKMLGIPATDNRQQEEPAFRQYYASIQQPTVPYGDSVEKLDATAALAKYKPQVVVACWVTHRFDPLRPDAGGSETGIDEEAILASADEYIFVGNEKVHASKPILRLPYEKLTPPWVYSRAVNGSRDFIGIWRRAG